MALKQLSDQRLIRVREEKAVQLISNSVSKNTRKNYTIDIKKFTEAGYELPCSPQDIVNYLVDNSQKLKFTTLQRRLKALKFVHKLNNYIDPTDDPKVKMIMQGISRKYGVPVVKAKPLTSDDLKKIYAYLLELDTLHSIRNSALFLVGFFGAFRRNELVRVEYRHISFTEEGLTILVPRSKTDQHNKGQTVLLPRLKSSICPVRALEDWLEVSKIREGYVFCPIIGQYETAVCNSGRHIADVNFNQLVKRIIKDAGFADYEAYSTHSLRRGFATEAHARGVSIPAIQRQGRWESVASVLAYIDQGHKFEGHPSKAFDD